jgi:hypothetical protein
LHHGQKNHLKFIHKVKYRKRKTKFEFWRVHFFCSGVMPIYVCWNCCIRVLFLKNTFQVAKQNMHCFKGEVNICIPILPVVLEIIW